jgi:hypothetical protein
MSVRSGKKTSRNRVTNYKGFDIIQVTEIRYHKSIWGDGYDSKWIDNKETHYDFCKEGNGTKPSQAYECWASNIAECKECIDNFIKDDSIYFTAEERQKYVKRPNEKCDYGYGYDSLMRIMREHQKADKRMKILLEDRLTDANFHSACGYLKDEDYEGFEKFVADDCKFNEKFEVYTHTKRKAIKDPKALEMVIKSAIDEALLRYGIKETSVVVRFCEEW